MALDTVNPYDLLEVGYEANEIEIKRKFRMLSILVHPDKNKDERAGEAFHKLEKAYKALADPERRRMYQRVMREARERVETRRAKQNEKRILAGQDELPVDNLNAEIEAECQLLFDEVEAKKKRHERLDAAYKKQ